VTRRGENAARDMLGVAVLLLWCGCAARVASVDLPPRDHPIEPTAADGVRPGMTAEEVARVAGPARVFGAGVSPIADHPWGADMYHVCWDPGQEHDRANGTWLYPIQGSAGSRDAASDRYLFVEMNGGVVSKAYRGRIGSWSM
jgi:hypothetical protein